GNVAITPNLATTTSPASSGCRSASSTSLANSGASSRNRTPRWASDAEPGRIIPLPPPTIAALVAVWCGARKGGSVSSETWGGSAPRHRVNGRDFQRGCSVETRQNCGNPFSQHRLARARRPEQRQVMPEPRGIASDALLILHDAPALG